MSKPQAHQSHPEINKRLKRAEGHLKTIIVMIEQGRSCVDIAQQPRAVEKAICNAKKMLIHDHIGHCLEPSVRWRATPARRSTSSRRSPSTSEVPAVLRSALVWLGFAQPDHTHAHGHSHGHDHVGAGKHGHTHGVIDPTIATTERGIWAIKWSFTILGLTAALQLVIVLLSSSVALLADKIHNVGDAATAVPL